MILDKLENADWYFGCVPGFQQFMQFFNNNDLSSNRLRDNAMEFT